MTGHHVELVSDESGVSVRFVCDNEPDAPCRRRDVDRECWAMSWWDAEGLDALTVEPHGVLARIPVDVVYDEGIHATVVDP